MERSGTAFKELLMQNFFSRHSESCILLRGDSVKGIGQKMKKRILYTAAAVCMLACGCSGKNNGNSRPVHNLEYGLDEAVSMIDEYEWYCAWLQTQDTISRDDAQKLSAHLDSLISDTGEMALCTQIDGADWEDSSIETLTLHHDQNQPTIYHEDISVVSAKEECQGEILDGASECREHSGTLTIRKEYTGDSPQLKEWYLEYIFRKNTHDADWQFAALNGTYDTEAPLTLRDSFVDAEYANQLRQGDYGLLDARWREDAPAS